MTKGPLLVCVCCAFFLCAAPCFLAGTAAAAERTDNGLMAKDPAHPVRAPSGLMVPRFASLRSDDVNMRTGPGTRYPIEWVFTRLGLPVEITAEYDVWCRARDSEGAEGWIHRGMLSGKRMAIIRSEPRTLRAKPEDAGPAAAKIETGAIGQILACKKDWCRLKFDGIKGWMPKTDFWGVGPDEVFE